MLYPHAHTVPSGASAREWNPPVAIATIEERPLTATGLRRTLVVPSPTWPRSLRPQPLSEPSAFRTTLWVPVPPRAAATAVSPDAETGRRLRTLVVPSPNSPEELLPHAQTVPSLRTASECVDPAPTATTP